MPGQIPQHFIDDLLARVDIVDVIDARVTLKKAGRDHKACCPFHNEKTPSFTVSQPKQFYHCFGCGANGSAINFLMEYENMHFVDAIEALAESVGMEVPRDAEAGRAHNDSKPLYTLLDSVASFYQRYLRDAPAAIDYLKGRGLSGETCKRFGIGYAPDGWDALQKAFPGEDAALVKTGMLKYKDDTAGQNAQSSRAYQRFRDRVMFPIRDRRGRVIAFGGRVMGDAEPKYLNSPETPLFHKGSEVYGLYEARKAAQDADCVLVVEGYMDVVALAEHGINHAVATLGTATNQQHSETLFKVVPNIVYCFDGDRAGRDAAWRALNATLPALTDGRDAHFLFLPDGEDPDSVVRNRGAAGFSDLLATRIPIIEFLYQHLSADLDMQSIGGKAQLADKAKPLVERIPQGVYQQLAMRRLESLIGISLGSDRRAAPPAPTGRPLKRDTKKLTPMSRAVLLILQHPSVVATLPPESFDFDPNLAGALILQKLISYCDADPSISTARLLERFRDLPEHDYLNSLAIKPWFPDQRELDAEMALGELAHCMQVLSQESARTEASKVDVHSRVGLLAIRKSQ